ncbi:MAG: hypothetical protein MJ101_05485 [Clostridia bacterium]|nr:hypothetical protein [Clostridia bacterium]
MTENKNLPTDVDNGVKVELYVKDKGVPANAGEVTIDLMEIVGFMKAKRRIFALLMAICVILGAAIPMVIHQLTADDVEAIAVVTFRYAGAANGKAPDGSALNVSDLKSSHIIQRAMDDVIISKDLSINDVAGNIEINGVLTEETMSQLEILQRMGEDKSTDYYKMLSSFEMKYGNRYIIKLRNSFGEKKVKIADSELRQMLSAILLEYNEYFFDTYAAQSLPANAIDAMELDTLDYVEQVEYLDDVLHSLSEYCQTKASAFPSYRSATDNLSFADLSSAVSTTISVNINSVSSEIFTNHVAKNYEKLLTTYDYYIRQAEIDLAVAEASLDSVRKMIGDYKNEQLVVMSQDTSSSTASQIASQTTEYYNGLIIRQMNISEEIAAINRRLAEYKNVVEKFSEHASSQDAENVEADVQALYNDCVELYDLIYEHTEELFSTSYFKNSYISSIVTMSEGSGLMDAAKNMAIGAAVGLVVGFAVWCCDGLIAELKKGGKGSDAAV